MKPTATAAPVRARAPVMAKASWNPAVSAAAAGWPACSRLAVRAAAMVAVTARPMAPPICWLALISPEARPASAGLIPVAEATRSPTKASPSAAATITNPGSRSVT